MPVEPRDPFDLCGVTIDGKYRVASVIGDGGFGVVYRGVHKGFGEVIAIKCLKLPASLDEAARNELLEKLQDEGRLLHRLSKATSGIVQALDVGAFQTDAGQWVPYLVMEWLEGETLAQYLQRREASNLPPLALAEAVQLLDAAAKALGVAHAQKVAHRDVKPANIFVSDVGGKKTTKVLDFGIAKVLSDHRGYTTALESTAMAPTAFTPRYGAPEQFNKQRGATGPWTDVFALALVLVECVSGRKALEGDDPTQLYIASADPAIRPTLRSRGILVPDAVEAALHKALEVEPKNRYANATDFWADLDAAMKGASPSSGNPSWPGSSKPGSKVSASDSMLETSEFAAKHQLLETGASSKSAFGPTMPVELIKTKKESALEDTDAAAKAAKLSTTAERERSSMIGWLAAGSLIFAGGGYFAYRTLNSSATPDPAPSASRSAGPSATTSAPRSADRPGPRPSSTASTKASAKPSVSVLVSAAPSVVPSATPSAAPSASAAVVVAPPLDYEDMVKIASGSVVLGEDGTETAVAAFFIDASEVTARRFKACVNAGGCRGADTPLGIDDVATWKPLCNLGRANAQNHPANCVTYSQADAYCTWLGKRLPSEAEWLLAAAGPNKNAYVWGSSAPSCEQACYDKNDGCKSSEPAATCEVGAHNADKTSLKLQDLSGNVSEWVAAAEAITKGGNFFDGPALLLLTAREKRPVGYAHPTVGFRCAASPK